VCKPQLATFAVAYTPSPVFPASFAANWTMKSSSSTTLALMEHLKSQRSYRRSTELTNWYALSHLQFSTPCGLLLLVDHQLTLYNATSLNVLGVETQKGQTRFGYSVCLRHRTRDGRLHHHYGRRHVPSCASSPLFECILLGLSLFSSETCRFPCH